MGLMTRIGEPMATHESSYRHYIKKFWLRILIWRYLCPGLYSKEILQRVSYGIIFVLMLHREQRLASLRSSIAVPSSGSLLEVRRERPFRMSARGFGALLIWRM